MRSCKFFYSAAMSEIGLLGYIYFLSIDPIDNGAKTSKEQKRVKKDVQRQKLTCRFVSFISRHFKNQFALALQPMTDPPTCHISKTPYIDIATDFPVTVRQWSLPNHDCVEVGV
ncbi:hypothetical protein [Cohaesibacter celericrescens]|uniref:Uncharacterized protein n=1 Tax=Cohaesibacter celericrescens TaxID=2067669 RepID=A0A2N5XT43_9HYPH|nr:hypothetical protein [Cohaesibacter celericrescens]PLW77686.1 hypothetical protein C0081_10380 [Cohaesibacter celericrescens]